MATTKTISLFSSKSNTLKILQKKIKYSKIEKIYDFYVKDWQQDKSKILDAISKNFGKCLVIVRSSAKGEDSFEKSDAGNYDSIQNVNSLSEIDLQNAINKVIKSYTKTGNLFLDNQVLIQKQTTDVISSGVSFTRSSNNEPYYIINFDDGVSTDSVTKGEQSSLVKIFRKLEDNKIPNKWKLLIKSFKELEKITNTDWLDIEFGITQSNKIVIFQVRPLISRKKFTRKDIDKKIFKIVQTNKKKYKKLIENTNLIGGKTIFSDMSDWNPAEILGNKPNFLDYSLYDYLIMKDEWRKGRTFLGYHNPCSTLMVKFGNKPYVDVRASFNSLIPKKINNKLKNKLMKFYLEKLEKNPHLHDKVEFDILFTCYDLTMDTRLKELKKFGFDKKEILMIKKTLINFTNEIIKNFPSISEECNNLVNQMNKNRNRTLSELKSINETSSSYLLSISEKLLNDCKTCGTFPFSMMARIAFMGTILLKSLVARGYLDSEFVEKFMMSIVTPLSEIQNDIEAYSKNRISKNNFLKKYGHLRPGTYDITALRYNDEPEFFERIKFLKQKKIKNVVTDEKKLLNILEQHGLEFINISFLNFVKNGLIQREKLKFEFTKNLSKSIELIVESGIKMGFTRNDLAYLDISTILKSKNKTDIKTIWKKIIEKNKIKKNLNDLMVLPPLIFSEKDFEIIDYYVSKPNFITSKKLVKSVIKLKNSDTVVQNLTNKIILIENADPGYDWIFTRNPSGLITKYGGVASHMAIRCSELGLPAAIGCGEILFEKLLDSNKILLDCGNEQLIVLEHQINDEYLEEKKILKSLGYIK